MVFPYANFNPSIIARMAGFLSLNQSSPRVSPKNHQTILLQKRMRCPGSSKKKRAFLAFSWRKFASLKSPSEPKKQRPGRLVANAVTCVLFVYVVSLLVLQNHAENLSRPWCGCILRFLNRLIRVKLMETCNKIKRRAVTLTLSSLP